MTYPPRPTGLLCKNVPLCVIGCLHAARRRHRAVSHRQAIRHKQIIAREAYGAVLPLPLRR